jgi:multidrug efflux pump subunit AcrA (membrane-fusion protein)
VGDLVNPTSVLATVSSIDPIRVRFQLDEPDYLRYLDGMQPGAAAARPFGALELELAPGKTFPEKGYLAATDRQVDLTTRTIGAEGLFPNPGYRLRPGQLARIRERG